MPEDLHFESRRISDGPDMPPTELYIDTSKITTLEMMAVGAETVVHKGSWLGCQVAIKCYKVLFCRAANTLSASGGSSSKIVCHFVGIP